MKGYRIRRIYFHVTPWTDWFIIPTLRVYRASVEKSSLVAYVEVGVMFLKWEVVCTYYPGRKV